MSPVSISQVGFRLAGNRFKKSVIHILLDGSRDVGVDVLQVTHHGGNRQGLGAIQLWVRIEIVDGACCDGFVESRDLGNNVDQRRLVARDELSTLTTARTVSSSSLGFAATTS